MRSTRFWNRLRAVKRVSAHGTAIPRTAPAKSACDPIWVRRGDLSSVASSGAVGVTPGVRSGLDG